MKRLTDRELWVLVQIISDRIAVTKGQSLVQILAGIRGHVSGELETRSGAQRNTRMMKEATGSDELQAADE